MHEAKRAKSPTVEIWGSGKPMREFMYIEDMADACLFLMRSFSEPGPINVGTGKDLSIRDLALLIKDVVGYGGDLVFDSSRPDGTPRKLLDVSRLREAGWSAKVDLREGVGRTYEWFLSQAGKGRTDTSSREVPIQGHAGKA
jgi:GDP-L-fucose synthase